MFTGIIETLGVIKQIQKYDSNFDFIIETTIINDLKIDQSIAHNGVCLTVVAIFETSYKVTAIQETISKTNLADLKIGDSINLERAMLLGSRLDGHIVQGHVDQTGKCIAIENADGSWYFTFEYDPTLNNITIEKGSVTVNGVSLTVVNSKQNQFSVAIIPYTYENTNFNSFEEGTKINLEFDVIGKYVAKLYEVNKL